jgi:hypothetical protein
MQNEIMLGRVSFLAPQSPRAWALELEVNFANASANEAAGAECTPALQRPQVRLIEKLGQDLAGMLA